MYKAFAGTLMAHIHFIGANYSGLAKNITKRAVSGLKSYLSLEAAT